MSVVKLVRLASIAVVLLLAITAGAVMLAGNGSSPSTPSPTTASPVVKLSTTKATPTGPTTTLPPSRDNDAGRARNPDITPDADADAYQRVIP